ncbi:Pimeloyl-ACP methyl ester carboxylesterase [Aquiflexum balticum DSM 16537]|uniref:Pimeloyl-ACP methyl ester carboxylesterase n=1 Tax=Aquiflexum balticum DSM 16537 TaxID=758820 RepID=A0A1W2H9G4_9BACT|nr:alpha/beta hydrolase [Aquiflexum balticum]SMD45523.1 Pimeloyl-ACP methyl ester carboxylesterase [Aquiflexum balticum DSM 16537]
MKTQIINTKKGTIEFSRVGTGIPILFIHGGHSSCNEVLFHKGFDTNRFCLITPSRPGYGNTPLSQNVSPKQTAALFVAMLDELKLKSVIVIGISAGGLSAIELASNFPARVTKLILISAVTKKWMTAKDKTYIKAKKIFAPKIEKFSWALFRFFYLLFPNLMAKTMLKELSNSQSIDLAKAEVAELFEMIKLQRSKNGFVNDLDQDIDQNVINGIACPTLILHSSNDNAVNLEHAEYAHSKIKNSILEIYDNKWGHLLWLGQESYTPIKDTLKFIE